ncbi:MAG: LysM peptidoglycan-binding domain-containing protein [Firmicutes bacterium]|uniref:LysM peptidoglycan-binding domain-containing protein n=1 Tax=Candidatus Gallilactobacillus intestinavium TaxID=2840838 RepID=A0A9D9H8M5_9LACO|nr:LysM peptidoglycan-binding domain-containing protein [Candidatus Gallilactobacillus intestinavium]
MHHDDDEHRQPWEETFSENSSRNMSRMARKRRKNGNTIFTSVLIIVILILALLPVGYYISNMSNFNHPTEEESSQTNVAYSNSVKHHEKKNKSKENAQNDNETDKQNESSASTTSSSQNAKYVTLQQNQGLYAIAKEHGISLQKLMELNGFNTPTPSLHPGYKIRIK